MSRVTVLGAGVVGSVYAALLAGAGHDVRLVARGSRLEQLRVEGLQVNLDGELLRPDIEVVERPGEMGEVLVVAVRGDQLERVLGDVAASAASTVMVLSNPLALRSQAEARIGTDRLVWCFSGVGGGLDGVRVMAHRVRQQPTVVQMGQQRSQVAAELLASIDPHLRREPRMDDWLDTHTIFIAAMAATIMTADLGSRHGRLAAARRLVAAMREAFTALERRGVRVTPGNLRAIFGQVPAPIATRYWAHQFGLPVVKISMEPHARATRGTEQPAVARHALQLVGDLAPGYRTLVSALA